MTEDRHPKQLRAGSESYKKKGRVTFHIRRICNRRSSMARKVCPDLIPKGNTSRLPDRHRRNTSQLRGFCWAELDPTNRTKERIKNLCDYLASPQEH